MSLVVLEYDIQDAEVNSARIEEETFRRKIVDLREGLRDVFNSHDIILSQGISNSDLLSSVAQICGQQPAKYLERLGTSWEEEYTSVAQRIGFLLEDRNFSIDTEPTEIIQAVQSRCMLIKGK